MIQTFKENPRPNFSHQILGDIGRGIGAFGEEFLQQKISQKAQGRENQALKSLYGEDYSGLSPEIKKLAVTQKAKDKNLSEMFGISKPQQQGANELGGFQPLSHEQKAFLALKDPSAFKAYEQLEKGYKEEEEKTKRTENLSSTLGEMINTLEKGNLGYTAKRATAQGRRDTQYFDTLGTQLESIGKDMVSKGVLSAPRFAYLLGNLPSSSKTDASNAGALEAWAKELDLKVPGIERLKQFYEEKKPRKKAKVLDEKAVEKIYDLAKGNSLEEKLEDAKRIAKNMGYNVDEL